MKNPNNCETCGYAPHGDGGHCYMFRDAPTEVCYAHTGRRCPETNALALIKRALSATSTDVASRRRALGPDFNSED